MALGTQAMFLADMRDHVDLHGLGQAQEYLRDKLNAGDGSSPARRLLDTMADFQEVPLLSSRGCRASFHPYWCREHIADKGLVDCTAHFMTCQKYECS